MQAATKRAKWRYFHIRPRDTNESVCMVYRHTVWINRCYNVIIGTRWSLEMWIDKNCAIYVCVHVFDCVITDQEEGSWAAAKMLWCGGGGGGGGVEKSHHFMLNKTAFLCKWWVCVVCRHRENKTQHHTTHRSYPKIKCANADRTKDFNALARQMHYEP